MPVFQGFPPWPPSIPEGWPAWASGGAPNTLLLGPPCPVPSNGGGPTDTIVPFWDRELQTDAQGVFVPPPPGSETIVSATVPASTSVAGDPETLTVDVTLTGASGTLDIGTGPWNATYTTDEVTIWFDLLNAIGWASFTRDLETITVTTSVTAEGWFIPLWLNSGKSLP